MLSSTLNSHQFQGWVCTRNPWQRVVNVLFIIITAWWQYVSTFTPLLLQFSLVNCPLVFFLPFSSSAFSF